MKQKIRKCESCGTEDFNYFDNGIMVMHNCKNNCLSSLRILQFDEDEHIIQRYWNWKKNYRV